MNSSRYERLLEAKMDALSGKYDEAISSVDELLKENGEDHEALRFKANVLELSILSQNRPILAAERQRELTIARNCYESILTTKPDDTLTLKDLADHCKNFGQIEEAQGLYHRITDLLRKRAEAGEDVEEEMADVAIEFVLIRPDGHER